MVEINPQLLEAMRFDAMRARMDRIRQILRISKGEKFRQPASPTAKQRALVSEYRKLEAKGGVPTGGKGRKPQKITGISVPYDGTFELADMLRGQENG